MSDEAFLDTNVLVYAFDRSDVRRQQIAARLLQESFDRSTGVISTQVLQEFFVTVTRKLEVPLSTTRARDLVQDLARFRVVEVSVSLIIGAIERAQRLKVSFWDSLILGAAAVAKCAVLYTEDLSAGATLDGVQIVNPFAVKKAGPGGV